ncbi:hypothetical protein MVEN_00759100 [Mycena venus]|uniref:Uncharacterized protein n=1 Tax=Mycena venus TaxID=2733690 RepID=A0A8H7D5Q1_9AGAR|nr:hypothetical protein MVEN_00759100 [Mycena venus]
MHHRPNAMAPELNGTRAVKHRHAYAILIKLDLQLDTIWYKSNNDNLQSRATSSISLVFDQPLPVVTLLGPAAAEAVRTHRFPTPPSATPSPGPHSSSLSSLSFKLGAGCSSSLCLWNASPPAIRLRTE